MIIPQPLKLPGDFEVTIQVRSEWTGGAMAALEETLVPRAFVPPHVHANDVWVYVQRGSIGVLVGEEVTEASAGQWALKPRNVQHAMWNAYSEPARIIEVLTPGGTERWFEEITSLADGDAEGFAESCKRHGIEFLPDSPWIPELRRRFALE